MVDEHSFVIIDRRAGDQATFSMISRFLKSTWMTSWDSARSGRAQQESHHSRDGMKDCQNPKYHHIMPRASGRLDFFRLPIFPAGLQPKMNHRLLCPFQGDFAVFLGRTPQIVIPTPSFRASPNRHKLVVTL
jgi:hypothetical protein